MVLRTMNRNVKGFVWSVSAFEDNIKCSRTLLVHDYVNWSIPYVGFLCWPCSFSSFTVSRFSQCSTVGML